eukprot:GHRQ01021346.1.p2 GENE.GHRQ01021346.1~~GHRQ01021346.1.p2  ORF type:complete len:128 (+),score=20.46 GHRQ01021346.1:1221-1604(+)
MKAVTLPIRCCLTALLHLLHSARIYQCTAAAAHVSMLWPVATAAFVFLSARGGGVSLLRTFACCHYPAAVHTLHATVQCEWYCLGHFQLRSLPHGTAHAAGVRNIGTLRSAASRCNAQPSMQQNAKR